MRFFSLLLCCIGLVGRAEPRAANDLLEFLPEAAARRAQRIGFSRDLALPGPGAAPRGLTGRVPALANEPFVVEDNGGVASRLTFTLENAAPVGGASFDRELTWPGAYPGVDVLAFATGQFLELSYLVHTPAAPRRFTWKLAVPVGASWRTEPGGRLLLERAGEALLAVPRPRAVDATGQELAVRFELEGEALSFTVVGTPRAFPVLLDPIVEVPLWELKETGEPFPRWKMGVAYDLQQSQTVLFGGTTPFGPSSETWVWNGLKWKLMSPPLSPPPREQTSMVFDAARRVVVLVGGKVPLGGNLTDTWTWDGTTWTQASASLPIQPPIALTWDNDRALVVAVGRNAAVATWNGMAWSLEPNSTSAVTLVDGYAAAYHPPSRKVVLFGGNTGLVVQDQTWLFDPAGWQQASGVGSAPPARVGHAMAFDPRRNQLVMVGGSAGSAPFADTWSWNGSTWLQSPTAPPAIREHALVYDSGRSLLIALGGDFQAVSRAAWEETSVNAPWQRVGDTSQPLARDGAAMTFDSRRNVSVLVGGARHDDQPTGDTFEWSGTSWASRLAGPPRVGHALAFDPSAGLSVAFGGNQTSQADTWNGATWLPRAGLPVRKSTLAWSSSLGLLKYGGIDYSNNRSSTLWVAAADGGWDPLATAGPVFIGSHAATFDEARGKLVLLGLGFSTPLHLEWSPDGGFVSRALSSSAPPVTPDPALTWDPDRARVVLFSPSPSPGQGALWDFDGTNWSSMPVATTPPPDTAPLMTFDTNRHRVVLQVSTGQTWEHSVRWALSSPCTTDAQCVSGFCADGVCCNARCAGGTTDCQACSPMTGFCELLPQAELCRAASGCARASSCSGATAVCPAPVIDPTCDAGVMDGGVMDGGVMDGGVMDGGVMDGGVMDGGVMDGGVMDGGVMDGGVMDGGVMDGGVTDGGVMDGGVMVGDGGARDGGATDAGLGVVFFTTTGCQSVGLGPLLVLASLLLRRRVR